MSKTYTAKDLNYILENVLSNTYEHMNNIVIELNSDQFKNKDSWTPAIKAQFNFLNGLYTILNDIAHPAHKISYKYFKGYKDVLDTFVKHHQEAKERNLTLVCYSFCCDPTGEKSQEAFKKIKERVEKEEERVAKDEKTVA